MLAGRAVPRHEANLRQGILETDLLGGLRVPDVILDVPRCALRDLADHETAGDVWHPVGELDSVWVRVDLVVVAQVAVCLAELQACVQGR